MRKYLAQIGQQTLAYRRHFAYLKYVMRHKYYVFVACIKLGVPIWIALLHDWDKFLPDEWFAYANIFYELDGNKKEYDPSVPHPEFAKAWLKHQNRNKHHWQFWLLTWDHGGTDYLDMPDVFIREMIADWMGAGRALGFPDTAGWYTKNRDKMKLSDSTRDDVERLLFIHTGYSIGDQNG